MNAIAYGLFVICLAIHTFISLSLPCERENDTSPIVKIHVKLPASKQPIPIRIKSLEFGNQMLRSLFLNHSAAFSVYMLFCYMCFCLHVFLFTCVFFFPVYMLFYSLIFLFICFSVPKLLFFCLHNFCFCVHVVLLTCFCVCRLPDLTAAWPGTFAIRSLSFFKVKAVLIRSQSPTVLTGCSLESRNALCRAHFASYLLSLQSESRTAVVRGDHEFHEFK